MTSETPLEADGPSATEPPKKKKLPGPPPLAKARFETKTFENNSWEACPGKTQLRPNMHIYIYIQYICIYIRKTKITNKQTQQKTKTSIYIKRETKRAVCYFARLSIVLTFSMLLSLLDCLDENGLETRHKIVLTKLSDVYRLWTKMVRKMRIQPNTKQLS